MQSKPSYNLCCSHAHEQVYAPVRYLLTSRGSESISCCADPAAQVYSIQAALASRQRAAHRCSSMRPLAGTAARALPPAEDGTATRGTTPRENPAAALGTPHQDPAWERATLAALVAAQTAQQDRLAEAARRRHAAAACAAAAAAQWAARQGPGGAAWLNAKAGGRANGAHGRAPAADETGICAEFDALVPWQAPAPGAMQSVIAAEELRSLAIRPITQMSRSAYKGLWVHLLVLHARCQ